MPPADRRASTSAILVNYIGRPWAIETLAPDNGLANLAGVLKAAGWSVLVMDYAAASFVERLVPPELQRTLEALVARLLELKRAAKEPDADLVERYLAINDALDRHALQVCDRVADEIADEVVRRNAAFVGFKLWMGEGQAGTRRIARRLKALVPPSVRLFGGGPHASCYGARVLEDMAPALDAIALGEGELTILPLAEHALGQRPLSSVPGIAWRDPTDGSVGETPLERVEDLGALPDPAYDAQTYPTLHRGDKLKFFLLQESRGCPYRCHFCFHPRKSGDRWRVCPPQRVAELMETISKTLDSRFCRLSASNPPPKHRQQIAEALIERGMQITYSGFGDGRSNDVDFDLLARSGCAAIFFGVESGSQRVLDEAFNKRSVVANIERNLLQAKRCGLLVTASLIAPTPFGDEDSLRETVALLERTRPHGAYIHVPLIVEGTAWAEEPERFGFDLEPDHAPRMRAYRARPALPPPLWDPLPYRLDGRGYEEMVEVASDVAAELEAAGIPNGVPDIVLVVSRELGLTPAAFRDRDRRQFMAANAAHIRETVAEINALASRSHAAVG